MRILKPRFTIETEVDPNRIMQSIEKAGRTCYKSDKRITADSAVAFVHGIVENGHHSVLEHESITVRFQVDRGISHEMVRHRIGASYSQESTRYCNYGKEQFGKEISVIKPFGLPTIQERPWADACLAAEDAYFEMVRLGAKPQVARSVLPTCLKTEIVVTMNLRAWMHFFSLRTEAAAHPQIREVARPLLAALRRLLPAVFNYFGFASSPYGTCPECASTDQPGDLEGDAYPGCLTCQWVGGYRPRMDWIKMVNEEADG